MPGVDRTRADRMPGGDPMEGRDALGRLRGSSSVRSCSEPGDPVKPFVSHGPGVIDELLIREARPEDADAIAEVFIASFGTLSFLPRLHTDAETFDFIANKVVGEQEVLVAELHGGIVGFAAMTRGNLLEHMYVHPDSQGQGVGSALLIRAKAADARWVSPLDVFSRTPRRAASMNDTICTPSSLRMGPGTRSRCRTHCTSGDRASDLSATSSG
jgi:GNAT superfamily N-acetyltransferase